MLLALTASFGTITASIWRQANRKSDRMGKRTDCLLDDSFLVGIALGSSCSFFFLTLQREFRLVERCRLAYKSWWGTNDAPLRKPLSLLEPGGELIIQHGEEGTVQVLVSNEIVASPTLHVTILTLAPGAEMASQVARGAEFYYVVSGSGTFSQQYVTGTFDLHPKDVFMVDPGNIRWITNRKGKEDLVLLRACDSGGSSNPNKGDAIRMDPNLKSLTTVAMDQLREGIRQVQQKMASKHSFNSPEHSTSGTHHA